MTEDEIWDRLQALMPHHDCGRRLQPGGTEATGHLLVCPPCSYVEEADPAWVAAKVGEARAVGELPDPSTIRGERAGDGIHWEWVPEAVFGWGAWRVVAPDQARQCRMTTLGRRCAGTSVAMLNRGREREQWWDYCDEHLYGRRVHDRRVWVIHAVPDNAPRADDA